MLFPTFTFILGFLPLTAAGYFLLAKSNLRLARYYLIIASFVFYSWFNWSYSLILAGSILGNWCFAQWLNRNRSKVVLALGITANVILLGYFKYYDFFIGNINAVFGTSLLFKHILLPLGISFFTFQQISFLQLVFAGELGMRLTFSNYALFVCFFPQLIAGPIVLPNEMMPQFDRKENSRPNAANIASGLYIFALGLAKKILLADFFAEIADAGFAELDGNFFSAWSSVLAYAFQIYFDFSGYCDMAIGVGLIFNIRLPVNFNAPYRAENIADFWRKWHITLGRFLMSGIYIPLGGNRKGKVRTLLNLLITFFISGLWHGASWLFVLWGMLHGAALIIHRVWSKFFNCQMAKLPAQMLTFFFVMLAWIPFRAPDWHSCCTIFKTLFAPSSWHFSMPQWQNILLFVSAIVIVLFFTPAPEMEKKFRPTWVNALLTAALIVWSMFLFVKVSPFIYFNF